MIDGGEVNTSITVESLIQCTETGLVTVSIEGVTPAAASALLDVILVIDESGSVDAVENELVVAGVLTTAKTSRTTKTGTTMTGTMTSGMTTKRMMTQKQARRRRRADEDD